MRDSVVRGTLKTLETQRRWLFPGAAITAVAALSAWYAWWSLRLLLSLNANGWDLGIFTQVVWNTGHGRWFDYSFRQMGYLGDHYSPALLLLAPLAWTGYTAEGLLIVQALALAGAAIPLFLATDNVAGRTPAWMVTVAYAASLGIAQAISFDFHTEAFTPLLAFSSFWAMAKGRDGLAIGLMLALLPWKEDQFIVTLVLCWAGWSAFNWRRRAFVAGAIAVAWGALVFLVLMPHHRGDELNPLVERYGYLGDTPLEVVWGALTSPREVVETAFTIDRLQGLLHLVLAFGLLIFLRPRHLLVLFLVVAPTLLSQQKVQGDLNLHYLLAPTAIAGVLVMTSMAEGWPPAWLASRLGNVSLRRAKLGLAVSAPAAAFLLYVVQSPIPPSFSADLNRFDVDAAARAFNDVSAPIGPSDPVSAQAGAVPRLAQREHIFEFPRIEQARWVLLQDDGYIPGHDIDAGFYECRDALPELGFVLREAKDGLQLWERSGPEPPGGYPIIKCAR